MSSPRLARLVALVGGAGLLVAACAAHPPGGAADAPPGASDGAPSDATPADAGAADWPIAVDPSAPAAHVGPELLGQYDLSGALYDYGQNAAAIARMKAIGLAEWRVGLGRWEITTRLLPDLTDPPAGACAATLAALPAALRAPAGATDASLVADRDWFTDDGKPVALADTASDARYSLAYVRRVIDTAAAYGARPFVDIDHMPRALSVNRTFYRGGAPAGLTSPCLGTWTNHVSNARPADPTVFAAAVVGMVRRVVEGSGGEPGRAAPYWELWNEPELGYAWDPAFEAPGSLDNYFATALTALVQLDAYRRAATATNVKALRFGLGSFAHAATAATVIGSLDTHPLPGGAYVPVDFVSFHSYANDPLAIVADVASVAAARDASTHYQQLELALTEWGPDLGAPPPAAAIDTSLLVATVLARVPALGVTRTHHSLFVDFVPAPGLPFTLVGGDGTPKPLYHAYELFHALIGDGGERLAIAGAADGGLEAGQGAALAIARGGAVRVVVVNRGAAARTVRVDLPAGAATPARVRVFDDPAAAPRDVAPSTIVTVPARAIALIEL